MKPKSIQPQNLSETSAPVFSTTYILENVFNTYIW